MTSDTQAPTVSPEPGTGKEPRLQVLVRLTEDEFQAMRRAMVELGVRSNQAFGALAISEKVGRTLACKQSNGDRRKGERRAA